MLWKSTPDAFKKLDPRVQLKNPVMFVVEVGGVAAVDESAITGESAPVIREAGGDRSAVTGGTTVLSDWIRVKITAAPGSTFIDRMIALVEGAQRQKPFSSHCSSVSSRPPSAAFCLRSASRA